MNDELDNLERELQSFSPPGLSAQVIARMSAEARRVERADRRLKFAMSAGALAACVIVGLILVPSNPVPAMAVVPQEKPGEFRMALALCPPPEFSRSN